MSKTTTEGSTKMETIEGRAIKPDYIVLSPDDLEPTPETTLEDAARFIETVEEITGVQVKRVGEIATSGPHSGSDGSGAVIFRGGIYRFLRERHAVEYDDEDYADLPAGWYERAWDLATPMSPE